MSEVPSKLPATFQVLAMNADAILIDDMFPSGERHTIARDAVNVLWTIAGIHGRSHPQASISREHRRRIFFYDSHNEPVEILYELFATEACNFKGFGCANRAVIAATFGEEWRDRSRV